jgi:protein-disulfide isomerase
MDFQCPFSSRVNAILKELKAKYGRDRLRVVTKHYPLPFHQSAYPAAHAAQAIFEIAGVDAFHAYIDLLFMNQRSLDEASLIAFAGDVGVDRDSFKAGFDRQRNVDKVREDVEVAEQLGVQGTPSFRINGVRIDGAHPLASFAAVIDAELAEAEALRTAGVDARKVYGARVAKNMADEPVGAKPKPEEPEEDTTVWKALVYADDPSKGPADALVTIVQWSEFQCPFCKRVDETLKTITETYPQDVRIVWKDNPLPFHDRAKPAAILARMAYQKRGNEGFWRAHDLLFDSQPKLANSELKAIAGKVGVDWAALQKAVKSNTYEKKLTQSIDLAADLDARGTPHFFINGRRIAGALPFEKFKILIDEQLAKAKGMLARGVPKAKIYDEIMKDAKGPERKQVPAADASSPVRGPANAQVTIHEFSDFQCPYCQRVGPTLAELEKEFPGKVKIVWHHLPLPFHTAAPLAAEAAQEAFAQKGNKGFWAFHDSLFAAQGTPQGLERENLEVIAQQLGLDMAKFRQALDTRKHKAKVDADVALSEKLGIHGTPSFVIGGYYLSGAHPLPEFKKLVRRALDR